MLVAENPKPLPESPRERVTETIFRWGSASLRDTYFANPNVIWTVSLVCLLFGLPWVAAGILAGFLTWGFVSLLRVNRWARLLTPILLPALLEEPEGLDDQITAYLVLEHVGDYSSGSTSGRLQGLQAVLAVAVGSRDEDGFSDCSDGHTQFCSHRVSISTYRYWVRVLSLVS
jgi:hypothetical protein